MGPDVENERATKPDSAASALTGGVERMFRVVKTDHPDLVGGIVWADCELAWISERITLAILAEREQCAEIADEYSRSMVLGNAEQATAEAIGKTIRMRSNVEFRPLDADSSRPVAPGTQG